MTLPSFPELDMFSAGINALYGVLIAGQPSHNRGYTAAGLLILAFFGGIGGGVTRDILLNDVPSPFRDPNYLLVCVLMGLVGLAFYHYARSRRNAFEPGRWLSSNRSPCPGLRSWVRIRRSITTWESSRRSSLG